MKDQILKQYLNIINEWSSDDEDDESILNEFEKDSFGFHKNLTDDNDENNIYVSIKKPETWYEVSLIIDGKSFAETTSESLKTALSRLYQEANDLVEKLLKVLPNIF